MHWLHWMERSFCFPALLPLWRTRKINSPPVWSGWKRNVRSLVTKSRLRMNWRKYGLRWRSLLHVMHYWRVWNRRRKSVMSLCRQSLLRDNWMQTGKCWRNVRNKSGKLLYFSLKHNRNWKLQRRHKRLGRNILPNWLPNWIKRKSWMCR